jgi:hypothetical protein
MMQLSIDFSLAREIMPREGTDNWRVWRMLFTAMEWDNGVTNVDFCDAHLANFRSRISELRREGYQIVEGQYVKEGVWRYKVIR